MGKRHIHLPKEVISGLYKKEKQQRESKIQYSEIWLWHSDRLGKEKMRINTHLYDPRRINERVCMRKRNEKKEIQ